MHELSIAMSLVDLAREEATRLGGVRIHALHIDVGALSGVAKEALAFAFDAAAMGTTVEGARLEIYPQPGRELILTSLEVEDVHADR